ncbi:hypothetical protein [Paraflavitalea sp. CAU 1676]|uniref:hypothetical protein n=1 Tax=Paraflavitalea sp. CAU 1676 TaxID=3032598 RepID=UPI0023DA5F00|nr:hypothetical protein [Paraflavitalea sp. CAU 1676]MDF2192099.1 hypothetical protein [Paraflavitalea sp. CAU 1676]
MKRFLLFALCCVSISLPAQDLTGIWRGGFRSTAKNKLMEMLGQDDRYKFEVQLGQEGKRFEGVTYSYLTTVFYGKATCQGTINPQTGKVLLEEIKIVEQRMSSGGGICIMTLFMQYSKVGDDEFLEGTYTSMKTSDSTDCGRGTVFLRKVPTSDFYKEPFLLEHEKDPVKKDPPPVVKKPDTTTVVKKNPPATKTPATKPVTKPAAKPPVAVTKPAPTNTTAPKPTTKPTTKPPANTTTKKPDPVTNPPVAIKPVETKPATKITTDTVKKVEKPVIAAAPPGPTPKILLTRENELAKTIVTGSNEIFIKIYDNGSVDNDTISVYLDKKLVLSKKRLTERALILSVKLDDENPYHELVMVAENLGEIPPNTSLMIVDIGKKQYEVRITSTEQKNAMVVFKYDKSAP